MAVLLVVAPAAQAFEVIGHRGAAGLRPANTLPAFQYGLQLGATAVEGDVGVTRDHQVVVRHDRRISGLQCSGPAVGRYIENLTLSQLRGLDCGTRTLYATQQPVPGAHVPTLGQLLRVVRPTAARVLVDVKHDPTRPRETVSRAAFARAVVHQMRRQRMRRRATVQSFDWGVLRAIGRLDRRIRLVALASPQTIHRGSRWLGGVRLRGGPFGRGLASAAKRAGFDGLCLPYRKATPGLIGAIHGRGMRAYAYTVDAPERMATLIARGIDGIVTDYPDRLLEVATSTGAIAP